VTASCARAGTVRRSVLVAGSIIPARISVLKSGYSIRNYNYGGAGVSYGLVLKNVSPAQDALQVSVLVNFVGPENKLIGSASSRLDGIPAGAEFALGGDLRFPGGAPIQRLEPVIQIGERAARSLKQAPLANIRVLPSPSDLRWVGSIEGEITNNQPSLVLQHASLSAVVFDSAGNVIGGGTGYVFASLPPNAREFFKLQSGFDAIPIDRVGGAMVSMFGRFEAPR